MSMHILIGLASEISNIALQVTHSDNGVQMVRSVYTPSTRCCMKRPLVNDDDDDDEEVE